MSNSTEVTTVKINSVAQLNGIVDGDSIQVRGKKFHFKNEQEKDLKEATVKRMKAAAKPDAGIKEKNWLANISTSSLRFVMFNNNMIVLDNDAMGKAFKEDLEAGNIASVTLRAEDYESGDEMKLGFRYEDHETFEDARINAAYDLEQNELAKSNAMHKRTLTFIADADDALFGQHLTASTQTAAPAKTYVQDAMSAQ